MCPLQLVIDLVTLLWNTGRWLHSWINSVRQPDPVFGQCFSDTLGVHASLYNIQTSFSISSSRMQPHSCEGGLHGIYIHPVLPCFWLVTKLWWALLKQYHSTKSSVFAAESLLLMVLFTEQQHSHLTQTALSTRAGSQKYPTKPCQTHLPAYSYPERSAAGPSSLQALWSAFSFKENNWKWIHEGFVKCFFFLTKLLFLRQSPCQTILSGYK